MVLVRTCWYLCALFFVTLVLSSAVCVMPDAEAAWRYTKGVFFGLSILMGGAAVVLKVLFKDDPERGIFKSKVVSRICVVIAVVLTLAVFVGVVG